MQFLVYLSDSEVSSGWVPVLLAFHYMTQSSKGNCSTRKIRWKGNWNNTMCHQNKMWYNFSLLLLREFHFSIFPSVQKSKINYWALILLVRNFQLYNILAYTCYLYKTKAKYTPYRQETISLKTFITSRFMISWRQKLVFFSKKKKPWISSKRCTACSRYWNLKNCLSGSFNMLLVPLCSTQYISESFVMVN